MICGLYDGEMMMVVMVNGILAQQQSNVQGFKNQTLRGNSVPSSQVVGQVVQSNTLKANKFLKKIIVENRKYSSVESIIVRLFVFH